MRTTRPTAPARFADGTRRDVPADLLDRVRGLDADGDLVVIVEGIELSDGLPYLIPVTPCCFADGKGGTVGVICRGCYRDVADKFGGPARVAVGMRQDGQCSIQTSHQGHELLGGTARCPGVEATKPPAAPRVARVHIADVAPGPHYLGEDGWATPACTDDVVKIRLFSRHQGHTCTWSILYVGPAGACRQVPHGPIKPGPYAALIPEATVISAHRMPGDRAGTVDLEDGDLVIIRGVAFRIDDRLGRAGHNPRLLPVTVTS